MTFFKPPYNTKDEDTVLVSSLGQPGQEHFIVALSLFIIGLTLALPNLTPVEAKVAAKPLYLLQCSDSDGSKTIQQGATKLSQLNTKTKKLTQVDFKTDQCVSATVVREYLCSFDKKTQTSKLTFIDVSCGGGQYCSRGACIPLPPGATQQPAAEVVAPAPITESPATPTPTVANIPLVQPKQAPAVIISGESPIFSDTITQTLSNNSHIGRFKITNNSTFPVTITNVNVTDNGTHWGTNTTFKLYYSDEGTSSFTANIAQSNNANTNFSSLISGGFSINGGSYRFVTVAIDHIGDLLSGDFFNLSINSINDVKYSIREIDWGYDGNGNGLITDTINGLPVEGRPSLGTLIKQ